MAGQWEKVGSIGVDAGLCWIGDPCYLSDGRGPMQDWSKFCSELFKSGEQTKQWDLGVSVQTAYGDGEYSVYVRKGRQGEVLAVMVDFEDCSDEEKA